MCEAQVLLKYTRTANYLPFPFCCADPGIKENMTIVRFLDDPPQRLHSVLIGQNILASRAFDGSIDEVAVQY